IVSGPSWKLEMLGLGIAAEMSWTMAVASNGAAVGEAESTAGMSTTGMGPVYLRRLGIPYAEGAQVGPRPAVRWEDRRLWHSISPSCSCATSRRSRGVST